MTKEQAIINESAKEYAFNNGDNNSEYMNGYLGFKSGAVWQKEQLLKESVEGSITSANGALGYDIAAFRLDENHRYTILLPHKEGRKYGDKVRIVIMED